MALVVFTGGARSGKSKAAENLALGRQSFGQSVTVAVFGHSAQGQDAEYAERIERHRASRPAGFITREYHGGLGWIDAPDDGVLVVDCLGTLLGRVMEEEWARCVGADALGQADADTLPEGFEARCVERLGVVVSALRERAGDTIVVTNEVGDGVVPAFASGRLFRDLLGRANRSLVQASDSAYLVVAGRLLDLSSAPRAAHWPHD